MPETITDSKPGFTLIELLVAIGILVLLASILVPVVGTVRDRARAADTQAFLNQLEGSINRYQTDFRAFPGPFSDDQLVNSVPKGPITVIAATGFGSTAFGAGNTVNSIDRITGSENLTLGLLGGLRRNTVTGAMEYRPSDIGSGPASLNTGRLGRSTAYVDTVNLSWNGPSTALTGAFSDEAGVANDTIIPEFVDRFGSPLPILYMRSRLGGTTVISDAATTSSYNMNMIYGYTQSPIGVGRSAPTAGLATGRQHGLTQLGTGPFIGADANQGVPYFTNTAGGLARNKDRFILISAGRDRVYGTGDDITNFGRF